MRVSRDFWVLAAALALLGVVIAFVARPAGPEHEPPRADYTSYGTGETGTKALYLVLKRLGYRVKRSEERLHQIDRGARALVVTEPDTHHPISSGEANDLKDWVGQGNTLIVLGAASDDLLARFDVRAIMGEIPQHPVRPRPGRYAAGVASVELSSDMRLTAAHGRTLVADRFGATAVEVEQGRGRAIFLVDPELAANRELGRLDNSVFLVNIFAANVNRGETILFDEYHHGYQRPEAFRMSRDILLSLLQAAVVIMLVFYSVGRRFGSVQPLKEERGSARSGWEYIKSMASLHRRAGARRAALDSICLDFRRELATRYALPPTASPSEMAEAAMPESPSGLARVLSRCENAEEVSDTDLVHTAAQIEQYRRELRFGGSDKG